MKPQRKLAETLTPDGACLTLHEHDSSYCIRLNGQGLMHSSVTASELQLGALATAKLLEQGNPCLLVGGLGLGFTLKKVLENVGAQATVQVAELIPQIVEWNRSHLSGLNGALLSDPRVQVIVADVWNVMTQAGTGRYDAILLDIDNGPTAMVQKQNGRLYDRAGVRRIAAALKPGGRVAIWSARPDRAFADRLSEAGFKVEGVPAKLYPNAKRTTCIIYVADKASE
jgi:spermidine synthase